MTVSWIWRMGAFLLLVASPMAKGGGLALFVRSEVKPELRGQFLAAVQENVKLTRQESTKPRFDLFVDVSDPNRFFQFGTWKAAEDYAAHLKLPHAVAAAAGESELLKLIPYRSSGEGNPKTIGDPTVLGNAIVVFETNEPFAQEFLSEFDKLIHAARKATGNLVFELYQVSDRPGTHVLFERWENMEAYTSHLNQPYVKDFYKHLATLVSKRERYLVKDISPEAP